MAPKDTDPPVFGWRPELPENAPFRLVLRGEVAFARDPDGIRYEGRVMGWSTEVVVVHLRERLCDPGGRPRDAVTLCARRATGEGVLSSTADGRGWSVWGWAAEHPEDVPSPKGPQANDTEMNEDDEGDELPW